MVALGVLAALALLEIAAILFGGSLMAGDADADADAGIELDGAADAGADAEFDVAAPVLGADADGAFDATAELAAALAEIDGAAAASAAGVEAGGGASVGMAAALLWLGVGRAPFIVWLAAFLCGFGLAGLGAQSLIAALFGGLAPWALVLPGALLLGALFAKASAETVARWLPNVTTSAVSARELGGRLGVVVGPEGRAERPTEVRVTDRRGRAHYLRAAPLDADGALAPRADVIVLRKAVQGVHRAIQIDEARDRVAAAR
ncbi:MAG: OB-fold-containig protein [Pseudomonadota bacterium]